jgi:hypothetical protein
VALLGLAVMTFVEGTAQPTGERTLVLDYLESPEAAPLTLSAPPFSAAGDMPIETRLPHVKDARHGRNSKGGTGYYGPRPPVGDAPHHYHFELFALDIVPTLDPEVDRTALVAAMWGHVVATGELVGTFEAPFTD